MFMLLDWEWDGGGRAKGFGGPVAPAESSDVADGDGGGSTTPDEWESVPLRRVDVDVASVEFRGEPADSAVALPLSDCSSGICTFRRGRAAPPTRRLFEREGGVKVVSGTADVDTLRDLIVAPVLERWGSGGDDVFALDRETLPTSTDCDRLAVPTAGGGGGGSATGLGSAKDARC